MKFDLTAKKVTCVLGCGFLILLAAHLVVLIMRFRFGYTHLRGLSPMFHFDAESSVPALFSSFLLALSAMGLWLVGRLHRRRSEGAWSWCSLALIFGFLSIDETVGIHERLSKPSYEAFGDDYLLTFGWLIPYQIAVAVIALVYLRFLWRLPRRTAVGFVVSGLIFLMGAVGMEILAARQMRFLGTESVLQYHVIVTIEESLEMIGIICFIGFIVDYLHRTFGTPNLAFSAPDQSV